MPKLLIIIPCYREAQNLSLNLPKVCRYVEKNKIDCHVLIVEGEVLDNTADIVTKNIKRYSFIKFISTHKGKGHQVKTGLRYGLYDKYLFMDADLATPLKYIKDFLTIADKEKLDLVTGYRTKRHGNILRKSVSITLNFWLQFVLGFKQTDTQCGFKLISKRLRDIIIVKQINQNWIFDIEYFIIASKNGFKVKSIPIPDWVNDYEGATLNTVPKFIIGSLKSSIEFKSIMLKSWNGGYKKKDK
jgi:dolichyl-phosphate beta-glucosyltransferase